jgi:hypothetical protein
MLRVTWVCLLLVGLFCLGCAKVQRTMSINTDPPGALLIMNDQEVGRTPVTRDFIWYGWYDVVIRKEGYKTLKTRAKVIAPAWQWPPFDLLAEFSPARLKDRHQLTFTLEPEDEVPSNDDMLGRAEQLRLQLESSPNTKNPSTRPVTRPATTQWTTGPATTEASTEPTTQSTTQPTTGATTGPSTMPTTAPVPPPTTQPSPKSGFL